MHQVIQILVRPVSVISIISLLIFSGCFEAEPLPATQESLSLETRAGDIYGTLEMPGRRGKVPLVLIISGSGPTNRDGNTANTPGKNDGLALIADALLEEGIASFRYDKRGVGESVDAIDESGLLFTDYIQDAISWMKKLRKDERFTSIGILGHSQGSLVGMIAASTTNADFFISVAGASSTADELLLRQLEQGSPPEVIEYSRQVLSELKKGNMVSPVAPSMAFLFREEAQPFLISWIQFDPKTELARLNMPISVVHGAHDIQIPLAQAQALADANPRASLEVIPGMNHVFKLAPLDPQQHLIAYTDPNIPLAEDFVLHLKKYLRENL